MSMNDQITRRRLLATAASFAAAAAINPFPKIRSVSAQDATPGNLPERAESQVLRWVDPGTTRLSVPVYDTFWQRMSQNVYMTPFIQDISGNITSGICSEYTISDDQLTYVFTMNPDAVWSDGSKITSHDIKYSWEWMANPVTSGNVFNYYQTQNVAGNADVYSGAATEMSGLVALDDNTLQITLSQPYTPFLYYCTHNLMGAHQRANIENGGPDWDKKPTVASGPFMVESFDVNSGAVALVQNPHWWGKKPTIERIELNPVADAGTQLIAWGNDECEVWGSGPGIDFFRQFGLDEVLDQPAPSARFFLFNTKQPPLEDVHVRRALQRATDVQTMVAAVFAEFADYAHAATGISDPTDPAYLERPFLFNVDEAKAELAQSAYANGSVPPIVAVVYDASEEFLKLATVMQQMWQDALGIQLQVIPADQASAMQTQNASIQGGGNSVLYLGPGGLLSWGWHKDNYWFNGRINTADDEVEALLNQGDGIPVDQVAERAAVYAQAEQLILDRGYVLPLHWEPWNTAVKKRLVNAAMNPTNNLDVINSYIAKS
jgi:ABC-type transport system substrate-binding protein